MGQIFLPPFFVPVSYFLTNFAPYYRGNVNRSRPDGGIFKKPTYDCSSAIDLGFGQKSAVLGENHGAPSKMLEKVPFLSHSGRFSAVLVGHRGFDPKLHFFLPNPRSIAELQ